MSRFTLPLFPEQASTIAAPVDHALYFLLGISVFFGLLIAGLIVVFMVRYRRRSPDEVGAAVEGSLVLESAWTIVPLIIVIVIFFWGASLFARISLPPADAIPINVVGKQWMWKLQHMEGRREIDELHIPAGRPVRLTLTSEDVIHSFYVPAFRTKQDAVPGRYSTTWFQATKVGTYHLFCAEYCGTLHSGMIGRVVVMDPADFERVIKESEIALQVCTAGNLRTTLLCARLADSLGAFDRFIIATDTPTGSGIMPLGMLYTIAHLASLTDMAPERFICAASGSNARVYRLDSGFNVAGRVAYVAGGEEGRGPMADALKTLAVALDETNHSAIGLTRADLASEFVRYGEEPWVIVEGHWWRLNPDRPDLRPRAGSRRLTGRGASVERSSKHSKGE